MIAVRRGFIQVGQRKKMENGPMHFLPYVFFSTELMLFGIKRGTGMPLNAGMQIKFTTSFPPCFCA